MTHHEIEYLMVISLGIGRDSSVILLYLEIIQNYNSRPKIATALQKKNYHLHLNLLEFKAHQQSNFWQLENHENMLDEREQVHHIVQEVG